MRSLREALRRRDKLVEAYQNVFDTPSGQLVLAHLAKNAFVFEPTFARDSHETFMNEGSRRVVLSILKMLNTDLGKLRNMMEEQQDV